MNSDSSARNGDLPEGWAIVAIGNLFDAWGGATPSTSEPSYWNGEIPWISSKDVKETRISQGSDFVTEDALAETRLRLCPTGTVLLVVRSGILANKLPVAITTVPVVINQDLKALDCGKTFLNEWLALALKAQAHEILLANRKDGTTVQSIKFDELKLRNLHVPPRAEQIRIVAHVEKLLARVNESRERLDRVPGILKRFRQSILAAACSGQLTADWRDAQQKLETGTALLERSRLETKNWPRPKKLIRRKTVGMAEVVPDDDLPKAWAIRKVRDLVQDGVLVDFQDGNHGSLYPRAADFGDVGVKFLTAAQVFDNCVLLDDTPLLRDSVAKKLRIGFAKPRDVLLTHNATVGRVAMMPEYKETVILGTSVTYYRFRGKYLLPEFVSFAMQSHLWQNQLRAVMEQTTRNQVSVNKQVEFWLPVPPRSEQQVIASRVQSLLTLADSIETRLEAGRARANALTQSILRSAFRGELVPTEAELAHAEGRDYEPASTLLARIQAERNGVPSLQESTKLKLAQVSLDLLLLLEAWGKAVSIIPLEAALSLMQQPDAIKTLDKVKPKKRSPKVASGALIRGLDGLYNRLVVGGFIKKVGKHAYQLTNPEMIANAKAADRKRAAKAIQDLKKLMEKRELNEAQTHALLSQAVQAPYEIEAPV